MLLLPSLQNWRSFGKDITWISNKYRQDLTAELRLSELAEEKDDLSDYISHNHGILSAISLLSGFLFSAIAVLVSIFPSLNSFQAQIVLLGLTGAFDLALYTLMDCIVMDSYYVRKLPPFTKHLRSFNLRLMLMFYVFGAMTVFLFVLWNLFYLTLVSGVMWGIVVGVSYFSIVKPFSKYRNQKISNSSKQ